MSLSSWINKMHHIAQLKDVSKLLKDKTIFMTLSDVKKAFLLIFFPIAAVGQIPNTLSATEKVYGLSKLWQEVNYNFIYFNKVGQKKWDSAYMSMIPKVQQTKDDFSYYQMLQKFSALLKDAHTSIVYPQTYYSKLNKSMFGPFQLFIENIEHKAVITHINRSKKSIIPPGSEIIAVNQIPTKKYIAEYVAPYISANTNHFLEEVATEYMLEGFENEKYSLTIKKPNQEIITVTVKHSISTEKEIYPPIKNKSLLDFKWYENQIAYLSLNSFSNSSIDSLFMEKLPELTKAKGLVIDLRNNGGGSSNIALGILKYFIADKEVVGARGRTRSHNATYKAWGASVSPEDTAKNYFNTKSYLNFIGEDYFNFPNPPRKITTSTPRIIVPTVLLIGSITTSAAEDFLIFAHGQKHFTKMGTATGGSTGQPLSIALPGGASLRVCTKQDTYPNGEEFVGFGIQPDIWVEKKLADYLLHKDTAMENAIEFLKKKLLELGN